MDTTASSRCFCCWCCWGGHVIHLYLFSQACVLPSVCVLLWSTENAGRWTMNRRVCCLVYCTRMLKRQERLENFEFTIDAHICAKTPAFALDGLSRARVRCIRRINSNIWRSWWFYSILMLSAHWAWWTQTIKRDTTTHTDPRSNQLTRLQSDHHTIDRQHRIYGCGLGCSCTRNVGANYIYEYTALRDWDCRSRAFHVSFVHWSAQIGSLASCRQID